MLIYPRCSYVYFEVSETEWVARTDLPEFLAHLDNTGGQITPWFRLITKVKISREVLSLTRSESASK